MIIKKKKVYKINPDCDLERLKEIVRANNVRIAAGEETTVCLGHTTSDDPELLTIPVGHAKNFEEDGESLYCDLVIDDEWADQIKKYNKVSVELWADQIITPIALLAKNRPALEVGLIKYQMPIRENIEHSPYITDEEVEVENMSPAEIQQLFTETMQHSEFYGKFCDLMENIIPKMQETVKHMEDTLAPLLVEEAEEEGNPELEAEGKEMEGDSGQIITDKDGNLEKMEKMEEKPEMNTEKAEKTPEEMAKEPEKKEEVEKNDLGGGGMASASANNTYIPDLEGKKKKKDEEDVVKHYQSELLKVEAEKLELVQKYQIANRKNELNDLSKTYYFDPSNEIEIVSKMSDEQWDMHKTIIATRYQKSPTNRLVSVAVDVEDRNVSKPDKVQKAIRYAQEHSVDFKTALDRV